MVKWVVVVVLEPSRARNMASRGRPGFNNPATPSKVGQVTIIWAAVPFEAEMFVSRSTWTTERGDARPEGHDPVEAEAGGGGRGGEGGDQP